MNRMIAFEIYINDKYIVTAGQEDWSVLAMHVNAVRDIEHDSDKYNLRFSVGGLSQKNRENISEHFRWPEVDLKVGDKVHVKVVETNDIVNPKKRFRSDNEVQENPFTEEEWKEMRYKDYLELKKEFEPGVT